MSTLAYKILPATDVILLSNLQSVASSISVWNQETRIFKNVKYKSATVGIADYIYGVQEQKANRHGSSYVD